MLIISEKKKEARFEIKLSTELLIYSRRIREKSKMALSAAFFAGFLYDITKTTTTTKTTVIRNQRTICVSKCARVSS